MKVIVAPSETKDMGDVIIPAVFLAGGITNCPNWQKDVIKLLERYDNGVLWNPRRENFPIDNPNAAREQIEWEFHALNECDVFSIWFSASESDQPICMYELGRHLTERAWWPATVIIGIEPGYRRELDVRVQTELVDKKIASNISNNLEDHAKNILNAIDHVKKEYEKEEYK